MALGSYWTVIAAVLTTLGLVWRLFDEENFLAQNLPGYNGILRRSPVASRAVYFLNHNHEEHSFIIRVEKVQKVISNGMYGLVRYSMYIGALFLVLATPLAFGSWRALLLTPLAVPALYFRIANEERVLLRDFRGYAEYRAKVRWHLIPGIF